MNTDEEIKYLLQEDRTASGQTIDRIGKETWLTVYSKSDDNNKSENYTTYSALIPVHLLEKSLQEPSWDITIAHTRPGITIEHHEQEESLVYYHFGNPEGIEPLVIRRYFHNIKPVYHEILEDFRLFHNLFYDRNSNTHLKIDEAGDETTIIKVSDNHISIRLKEIRQYLSVRNMFLAVLFDFKRYSSIDITAIPEELKDTRWKSEVAHYRRVIGTLELDEKRTFSRLLGKKVVSAIDISKSGVWPFSSEQEKMFESFIIGTDDDDTPIFYSSNPDLLSNFFGANPQAPHYLTPIFFRTQVLSKYYNNPNKYSIDDGYLSCGSLWGIQVDNNHNEYVIVFLGDLGRDMPYTEQKYWRSFNVVPDGEMSTVNFQRSFLAEFAEPTRMDLRFKDLFTEFQSKWEQRYGWKLFKSLSDDDQYLFHSLRIPVTDDLSELDSQILAITKLIIDSINEEELQKLIKTEEGQVKGSISRLEKYLEVEGFSEYQPHIQFLRNLQSLRSSSVGHRKGEKYKSISARFGIGEKKVSEVFEQILENSCATLNYLLIHMQ